MLDQGDSQSTLPPTIARLPVDLNENKLRIARFWAPIVLSSCILPIVGYFVLHYETSLKLMIVLSIFLAIMGAVSLLSLLLRTWALFRANSTCRPLGTENNRWAFDYFWWNFAFMFCVLTAIITSGIVTENMQIVSLPLSILVLWITAQMALVQILMPLGFKVPFRMSSLVKGEDLRPGIYVIIEDCVAVEGKQGTAFRQAWNDRYVSSPHFRRFLCQMERLWAATGLSVVAVVFGVVFGLDDHEIGYALGESLYLLQTRHCLSFLLMIIGWGLPFLWAAVMALITTFLAKGMLRREEAAVLEVGVLPK